MDLLNKKILDLWSRYPEGKTNGLIPLLYSKLETDQILFIGLNPSFSEKGIKRFLGESYEKFDPKSFYSYINLESLDINKLIEIENKARANYPYFNKFKIISNYIGIGWVHVDLFFIRETNQKSMKLKIFEKPEVLNNFALEQLKISKEIIEKSEPKLIVVANALASRIFEKYYNAKFDEKLGFHKISLGKNKNVPVFLCSMLTGQRAMDNFTFNRLKWHIKNVI